MYWPTIKSIRLAKIKICVNCQLGIVEMVVKGGRFREIKEYRDIKLETTGGRFRITIIFCRCVR